MPIACYGADPTDSNVTLICPTLQGTHQLTHWWPGVCETLFDVTTECVVCVDTPASSVQEIVQQQKDLLDRIGIHSIKRIMGGCFGGMQVLEWCRQFPEMIDEAIAIACSNTLSPHNRAIITLLTTLDPRSAAHFSSIISFTPNEFAEHVGPDVERYFTSIADKYSERFDKHSFCEKAHAMLSYACPLHEIEKPITFMSFTSDWRYPPSQMEEMKKAVPGSTHVQIETELGHKAFIKAPELLLGGAYETISRRNS